MEQKATIYGVRTGDTYHYIGKTSEDVKADGKLNNSDAQRQYHNSDIREIFINNENVEVIPLKTCAQQDWYDEKLDEVVDKYKDEHPLLNAQWMLDGKRGFWEGTQGYWQGKERDAHTLQRLSESKFKKVVQYDKQGNLVKVWESGKEVAEKVFGDYRVVNGAGETSLYDVLNARTLKGRLRYNSYWFWENKLVQHFGVIPNKLNVESIRARERKIISERMKIVNANRVQAGQRKYTVIHYNNDGSIKARYDNTQHAAFKLKISVKNVRRLCKGTLVNHNYNLKYGEKIVQQIAPKYPKYKTKEVKSTKPRANQAKPPVHTRTYFTVNQYENGCVVNKFNNVREAAQHFGLKESAVRRICRGEMRLNYNNYPDLKLGEKQTVII